MRILAFSGGKDSTACLHLLQDSLECAVFVDTGYTYPETKAMIEYAKQFLPVHIMYSKRREQNEREGIPSDIVPIDWTTMGHRETGPKPVKIQSYLGCCFENIAFPLLYLAKQLGATELVYGQRNTETHKSAAKDGDIVDGIKRIHPIEGWSEFQVMEYLESKMAVPAHFYSIRHSSLDCYDCTAFRKETADRVRWTESKYPLFHKAYEDRVQKLNSAIQEALA